MKNKLQKVIAAGALVTLCACSYCPAQAGVSQADLEGILKTGWQAYQADKPNFEGGLALQILSPKGEYFVSTGLGDGLTNRVHLRIASVTKTFTGAAIMLLYQRGKLRLDDAITENIPGTAKPYVPATPEYDIPYKGKITIRMLLMHRAGVFDVSNSAVEDNPFSHGSEYVGKSYLECVKAKDPNHTFTCDELAGVNARYHLSSFKPGTSYHYSNTGFVMLATIVERVSGISYADFVRQELLVPNGLLDTSLPSSGSDQLLPEPFVRGYVWKGGQREEVTRSNMSPHVGEGNIISTPMDLARWCRRLFKGEAGLGLESVSMMTAGMSTNDGTGAAYGFGVAVSPQNGFGHAGAHEGYLTLMWHNPKTDVSYVMFANVWNCQNDSDSIKAEFKPMTAIADQILAKIGASFGAPDPQNAPVK